MALRPLAHLAVLGACAAAGCGGTEPAAPEAAATPARRPGNFAELPELFGAALPQLDADRLRPQQRARRLAGGPWFQDPLPRRDLADLRDVLSIAGFEDLAAELEAYSALRIAMPAEPEEE